MYYATSKAFQVGFDVQCGQISKEIQRAVNRRGGADEKK